MKLIGVDLGGTNIKAALVNEKGQILRLDSVKTMVHEGKEEVCRRMAKLIKDLAGDEKVMVGIGSPGSIDRKNGIVKYANNLPDLSGFALTGEINKLTGFKTFLENDAKAAALGERWFGSARNTENFIVITLGTGVGGGAYTQGHLIVGGQGFGGELGHITVDPHGQMCSCGSRGCLETFAAISGMRKRVLSYKQRYPHSRIFELSGIDFDKGEDEIKKSANIGAKEIFEAFEEGDRLATLVVRKFNWGLGIGIGSLVNIFNPEVVILSGGISQASNFFIDEVKQVASEHTYLSLMGSYDIIPSELKNKAAILGAASVSLERTSS